ncbi:aliphatic sulfonate ABC transporter substrate-binding protein [Candidatus Chlorobium masyuteum]|uniref:aliphatic sulfonate ABC transporter substrate-binding protein n=1 Tax=Candidatus Chlorobium masyuteum TaxID=2716876 RepID=UPI001F272705|nr:aliphatic sulfonate ABC transporter substrate-binding protein [Candidatus Chlorobium masyuteum]
MTTLSIRKHSVLRTMIRCIGLLALLLMPSELRAAPMPSELRIDYADYNPLSYVLKKFGWLEKEFEADHVAVRWIFSEGSNQGLDFLTNGSVDFASTSALPSLISKAKGSPIKAVYIFSHPDWISLVVNRDSPIKSVRGLKGKKIAATPVTEPYFFLLRALHEVGLQKSDVIILPLNHKQGRIALETNKVDAWAGIDPYGISSQLESGSRVIYRNEAFNSNGFLTITEPFAVRYPDVVSRVIRIYERVRKWAVTHPDDLAVIYSDESGISLPIAKVTLSKVDLSRPVPAMEDIIHLREAVPVLVKEKMVSDSSVANKVIDDLVDPAFLPGK